MKPTNEAMTKTSAEVIRQTRTAARPAGSLLAAGIAAFVSAFVTACGPDEPPACAVMAVQACTCTTGATGAQTCLSDGTWGACSCAVGDAAFSPYVPTDASRLPRFDARAGTEADATHGGVTDGGVTDVKASPH